MKTNPLVAFLCLCAISIPFGLMAAPYADHKKGRMTTETPYWIRRVLHLWTLT